MVASRAGAPKLEVDHVGQGNQGAVEIVPFPRPWVKAPQVCGEELEEVQIDWDSYDLLFAVGPTVDMGGWNLYGGPFYYMHKGDLDVEITETYEISGGTPVVTISTVEKSKESGDLEADSFGGFVGAHFTMMENYNMTTELSFTGDGWAIGAGVCYAF